MLPVNITRTRVFNKIDTRTLGMHNNVIYGAQAKTVWSKSSSRMTSIQYNYVQGNIAYVHVEFPQK